MDTMEMIVEAYTRVIYGAKRCDLENNEETVVKVYRVGDMIRIDIKEKETMI